MKNYKPSNQAPILGIALLALTLVAGLAIGGLVGQRDIYGQRLHLL